MSAWFERYARPRWAAAEPYWGMVHPSVAVASLACQRGRRGGGRARLRQRVRLGVAGPPRCAACWGGCIGSAAECRAPPAGGVRPALPSGPRDAEQVPLSVGCADLVISEYGASVWCDPYRWIPEAARLLRPGGRLVFMAQSTLARMCLPEQGPVTDRLVRDLFGLHRVIQRGSSGAEYRLFTLPHGEWIRLMGRCGLMVEDLIEVQVPPGAANNDFPELPDEWVRRGRPRRSGSPAAGPPIGRRLGTSRTASVRPAA